MLTKSSAQGASARNLSMSWTAGLATWWRSYAPLTKPTISLLVVVTVVPALFLASGGIPAPALAAWTLLGTYLASASAAVFNHMLDADLDGQMTRTRGRPVASGRVTTLGACTWGLGLGVASMLILYHFTTPMAAALALSANAFYVLGYTLLLKRHTDQNIVIGGAAGAVGPLIGWAAVSGTLSWEAWVLFTIIVLWTPPHFWALAIKYKDDYAAAGVPMLPVTRGLAYTRRWIFIYTLTLLPAVASLYLFSTPGLFYLLASGLATAYFCLKAYQLWRDGDAGKAMPVFHYSCFYLFAVFGALTVDHLLARL